MMQHYEFVNRKGITKRIFNLLVVVSFLTIFFSCNSNDDNLFNEEEIIQKDAKIEDLAGAWSIYKVEYDGNEASVPATTEECGRDFFIYNSSGTYEEFLYQESYLCQPTQNTLNWTLNNGIITLSSDEDNQYETIKIKNLSKDNFVFFASLDTDGDAVKEQYTFTAYRYLPPNEMDLYTATFQKKEEEPFTNHIEFGWDAYNGYNTFEKYEIYRNGKDCNLNGATLLKTITDVNLNTFIDEDPLSNSEACYFLKIYTNKGLLGESDPRYINPEFIFPENVVFKNAEVIENEVSLSWEKYSGYYFSHYEIRVQDQNENSSPNIESVKIISDINTTTFIDENPPYVNNPIYTIYVHNIFGNISNLNDEKSVVETAFIRPELLDADYIKYLSFDPEGQSFYFYLRNTKNEPRLVKYDYIKQEITAEAFKLPTSYTEVEMKLITSENGKELVFSQSDNLFIYDAETLNYKYSLVSSYRAMGSFEYFDDNIWVLSDSDDVFTYKRNGDQFVEIDEKPHFSDHQGGQNYEITKLDKNNFFLSHNNEGRAIHYSISNTGEISNNGIIEIPLKFKYNSDVSANTTSSYLLNKKRNTVYSLDDFSKIVSYSTPIVTSNFSKNGTEIYGTNNDSEVYDNHKNFKKEIIVYSILNNNFRTLPTKGFPLYIAEDNLGNIISLSSGFPRNSYYDSYNGNVADLFVEIIK
ncbi:lipocalin family protein [Polaribacter sp. HaHaR_3_91]|uniref:lipocalin family protein n=1 Tax=Polaribacter sp. HaHaR_3_91 TaxID=2745561 RepID=UPI001C4F6679|nr:lipocalin family protein [Polaribacter sp. HaHaR_3_91]QXP62412.1 lipocalin family protein [Polaribacter sp. HaHaR_3_91]